MHLGRCILSVMLLLPSDPWLYHTAHLHQMMQRRRSIHMCTSTCPLGSVPMLAHFVDRSLIPLQSWDLLLISLKHPDNKLGAKAYQSFCKNLNTIRCSGTNPNMLHIQSGLSICHQQADPSKIWMLSPQEKEMFPRRCSPNSNSREGALYCTPVIFTLRIQTNRPKQRSFNR